MLSAVNKFFKKRQAGSQIGVSYPFGAIAPSFRGSIESLSTTRTVHKYLFTIPKLARPRDRRRRR